MATSTGMVVLTIALLVLTGVVLVIAAFGDRRRSREISHDRSRLPDDPGDHGEPSDRRPGSES